MIEGHSGWIRIGWIEAAAIVNQIDPRSIGALSDATSATENAQADEVGILDGSWGAAHLFHRQAPIVKTPWFTHAQDPLRRGERDQDSGHEIRHDADAENAEKRESLAATSSKGQNHDHSECNDRDQDGEKEEEFQERHTVP